MQWPGSRPAAQCKSDNKEANFFFFFSCLLLASCSTTYQQHSPVLYVEKKKKEKLSTVEIMHLNTDRV